jgi:hypothetical protein
MAVLRWTGSMGNHFTQGRQLTKNEGWWELKYKYYNFCWKTLKFTSYWYSEFLNGIKLPILLVLVLFPTPMHFVISILI